MIEGLNQRAADLGCVVFEGDPSSICTAVVFAGNLERFYMLAVARELRCPVIFVQDVESWWYQGSRLLPDLTDFCERFLAKELDHRAALLFGQSSGAYAALVASTYLPGSTVVACAPQTFADAAVKDRIHFAGIRPLSAPDTIIDLRQRLLATADPAASKTIVIAASELGNPARAHFWMDYLHALRLVDVPGIALSIVSSDSHVIAHGRTDLFAGLLNQLSAEIRAPVPRRNEIVRDFLDRVFSPADEVA